MRVARAWQARPNAVIRVMRIIAIVLAVPAMAGISLASSATEGFRDIGDFGILVAGALFVASLWAASVAGWIAGIWTRQNFQKRVHQWDARAVAVDSWLAMGRLGPDIHADLRRAFHAFTRPDSHARLLSAGSALVAWGLVAGATNLLIMMMDAFADLGVVASMAAIRSTIQWTVLGAAIFSVVMGIGFRSIAQSQIGRTLTTLQAKYDEAVASSARIKNAR